MANWFESAMKNEVSGDGNGDGKKDKLHFTQDPRRTHNFLPEYKLSGDSELWDRLLEAAWEVGAGVGVGTEADAGTEVDAGVGAAGSGEELCRRLWALRLFGTVIVEQIINNKPTYALRPVISPEPGTREAGAEEPGAAIEDDRGWGSVEGYRECARGWLDPYRELLCRLLGELG